MTDLVANANIDPVEWNATEYHRLSNPHVDWGQRVLDRLPLRGDEIAVDAGCGSGRLTALLLERLPAGRVIAVDRSQQMLAEAEENLVPRFGGRVSFVHANLLEFAPPEPVDAIFSTATFHWIRDHDRLFTHLFAALRPGGRLVAQCGGGPNLAGLMARVESLAVAHPAFAPIAGWSGPWEFAGAATTAGRLERAGFADVATSLEEAPTTFDDAATYREFLRTVVLRAHLERLADDRARNELLDALTEQAAADPAPFHLDYWRLNLAGRRPGA
ncbi:MAG: methyltransferase domain-containing protein [Thermomicrobiales bacterium]|nr:methyltransferase domain-containing protein [Thermomicrobiales bacterium]